MTVSAGAVFLIVQLVGGQPTMTVYATAGDCQFARDQIIAPNTAKCVEKVSHRRVDANGDVDWPLTPMMVATAPTVQKTMAPAAKRVVKKAPAKKPVKKPVKRRRR